MPKDKKDFLTSPVVTLRYPRLNEPDTKYKANGEYKVDLILDPKDKEHKAFLNKVEKLRVEAVESIKQERGKKKTTAAESLIKDELDRETEEPTGRFVIRAKLNAKVEPKNGEPFTQRPVVFDRTGIPLDPEVIVGGGSEGQVSMEPFEYFNPTSGAGLSLRLKAVLVTKLVEYTGGSADATTYGFDVDPDDDVDEPISGEDEEEQVEDDSPEGRRDF